MDSLTNAGVSFPILIAYGVLILSYLVILRLLLDMLQQMGSKHRTQKFAIDVDVHRTMTPQVDSSMQTFDVYSIAIVIAKGGIATLAMAAVITLLVIKVGILATALLIVILVMFLWSLNHWLKSREKPGSVRGEIRKSVQKAGSMGMIVMLSIVLVVLLFVMIWLH